MTNKAKYQLVYNRKKKFNATGQAPIEIRITLNRKVVYFSTKIYIKPEQWNKRTLKINAKHNNNIKLNKWLYFKLDEAENFELQKRIEGIEVSISEIQLFLKDKKKATISFPEWCLKLVNSETTTSVGTIKKKTVFVKRLQRFNKHLSFKDLDYTFMREFDNFLHNEKIPKTGKPLQQVTIHGQIKLLKYFLGIAYRERKISYVPVYKVKKGENVKEALTSEELTRIENLEFKDNFMLNKVKDLFLFASYTALRYSDIEKLNSTHIRTTEKGLVLYIKMQKVSKPISLPLHKLFNGKPEKILKQYLAEGNDTIFNAPTNQAVNRLLKIIKVIANIEKPLTFHISRHTCLTIIGKKTGNPYLVMKIAGHSDIKTSMKYTKGVIDEGLYDLL